MILNIDNREEWRAWLQKNHETENEVWLAYYKKHTGKPRIPYEDAVEEALCFGWIDSIAKRLDDERYLQKFTPRRDNSSWSEINKMRAGKMIREGKMTKAGLAKIKDLSEVAGKEPDDGPVGEMIKKASENTVEVPSFVREALIANGPAWENFNKLAPSYKRNYIMWISNAKKEETRIRRLKEAIQLLEQGKKLGMK